MPAAEAEDRRPDSDMLFPVAEKNRYKMAQLKLCWRDVSVTLGCQQGRGGVRKVLVV